MRARSDDLRPRSHAACEAGDGTAEVADRFAVSEATVRRFQRRFRDDGTLAQRPGDSPAEHAAGWPSE